MAGKAVAKAIDKNQAVEGLMGVEGKALVKPLSITAAGLAMNQIVRNQDVKNVGLGMATYGGILSVEAVTGNPVINGLQGVDQELPVYEEDIKALPADENIDVTREIDKLMQEEPADIETPEDVDQPVQGISEEYVNLTAGAYDDEGIVDYTAGVEEDYEDEEYEEDEEEEVTLSM